MSDFDDTMPQEPELNIGWLLTFADLISLMITFFVLLFSMKTVDDSQWDRVKGALQGVFSEQEALIPVKPEDTQVMTARIEIPSDSLPYLAKLLETEFRPDPILSLFRIEVDPVRGIMHMAIPAQELFPQGDTQFDRAMRLALLRLADKIRHIDNKVQVVGITNKETGAWNQAMDWAVTVTEVLQQRGAGKGIAAVALGARTLDDTPFYFAPEEEEQWMERLEIQILEDR